MPTAAAPIKLAADHYCEPPPPRHHPPIHRTYDEILFLLADAYEHAEKIEGRRKTKKKNEQDENLRDGLWDLVKRFPASGWILKIYYRLYIYRQSQVFKGKDRRAVLLIRVHGGLQFVARNYRCIVFRYSRLRAGRYNDPIRTYKISRLTVSLGSSFISGIFCYALR